jgi:hypothetical protein
MIQFFCKSPIKTICNRNCNRLVFFLLSDLENLGKKKKKKPAVNPDEIASEDEKVNKNFASAKF